MQRSAGPTVKEFMGKGVVTVYQESTVTKAVEAMASHNIGSVVVLDSLGPCGVFTERDLLSKVVTRKRDADGTVMTEVLSPSFPAIAASSTLEEAAVAMIKKRSRLMVFDGPDLVGMVTPTDIVKVVAGAESDFGLERVVSKRLVSVLPETPVDVAVRQLEEKRVGSVIVSDENWFEGIFTERDLLRRVLAPRRTLETPVREVSSTPLVTAEVGITGIDAAGVMSEHGIKRLPLSSNGKTAAMVTARDLVEAFASPRSPSGPRVDWTQWN